MLLDSISLFLVHSDHHTDKTNNTHLTVSSAVFFTGKYIGVIEVFTWKLRIF